MIMPGCEFLFAPNKNAYDDYQNIYNEIIKYPKNTIISLSLGPTAKVLAFDLHQLGYRALDLGHLAKDYNSYKTGEKRTCENIINFMKPD